MTETENTIAYDIGRSMAEYLINWDLFDSPEHAFQTAKEPPWRYVLSKEEKQDFIEGVKSYIAQHKSRKSFSHLIKHL